MRRSVRREVAPTEGAERWHTKMMMRKRYWIGVAVVAAIAYAGAYAGLRTTYAIAHHSNADHWFAEKRSPGHFVNATCKNRAIDRTLEITFWPVMRLEEFIQNRRG